MNSNDAFTPAPDLSDPGTLAQLLLDQAGGLEQQATAATQGSALGGHPFPAFFYGRTAEVARAAAKMIQDRLCGAPSPGGPAAGVASAPTAETRATPPAPAPEPPVTGSLPSGDERKKAKGG